MDGADLGGEVAKEIASWRARYRLSRRFQQTFEFAPERFAAAMTGVSGGAPVVNKSDLKQSTLLTEV
jgi:hypothetical protein